MYGSDRLMWNMMQSMGMPMPTGVFDPFRQQPNQAGMRQDPISAMMPHGLMNPMSMMMMDPFQSMQQAMSMVSNGSNGGFSYCSSSVTSYTTDEHGRPQVYQQSHEMKQGGGVKETKSSVRDSRTGHQELAIGHHIHNKSHLKKKSKNAYTGEEEQVEDFVNLDEAEAESFEQDWAQRARNITQSSYHNQIQHSSGPSRNNRLALTYSPTHRQSPYSTRHLTEKSSSKSKKKSKKSQS